jgi:hypothetical protein
MLSWIACPPPPPPPLACQDPGVRLASASALLALYSDPDNRAALADFTQRFAQRFGELFYDVDERVAVKGVSWGWARKGRGHRPGRVCYTAPGGWLCRPSLRVLPARFLLRVSGLCVCARRSSSTRCWCG